MVPLKKKVFTEIETDFLAEIVRFRLVGGMHPHPPLNSPLATGRHWVTLRLVSRPWPYNSGHPELVAPKRVLNTTKPPHDSKVLTLAVLAH